MTGGAYRPGSTPRTSTATIGPIGLPPAQGERAQVLDQCYQTFAEALERQHCRKLDVPLQRRSTRGAPARIKKALARRRGKAHFKSWTSHARPLHWLKKWVQTVLRYIQAVDSEAVSAVYLQEDLQDCYAEFRTIPELI